MRCTWINSFFSRFILELSENVNFLICFLYLARPILKWNSSINVFVKSLHRFVWRTSWCILHIFICFKPTWCFMFWKLKFWNWADIVIERLFEWVLTIDLVLQWLKVLLVDLKILIHFVELWVFIFDFLFVFHFPLLNLLKSPFECFRADSVVCKFLIDQISFSLSFGFNLIFHESVILVNLVDLSL